MTVGGGGVERFRPFCGATSQLFAAIHDGTGGRPRPTTTGVVATASAGRQLTIVEDDMAIVTIDPSTGRPVNRFDPAPIAAA